MRIVFYAVNGSGVGHLTRLLALAKWVRRLLRFVKVPAEIVFLTSSEETGLLFREGFPAFKLPSKTVVAGSGLDKTTYLALAKQWVWHSLGLLRPDLFVVDSFPRGAFGELLSALDLAKKKVFVSRRMKSEFAGRADFQAMLPLYDRIVLAEDAGRHADDVPSAVSSRVARVGPIVLHERCERLSRVEARRELGLDEERPALLLTAGGGGDPTVESRLRAVVDRLKNVGEVTVAAGPLYRGARIRGVHWFTEPHLGRFLPAFDVAVAAAGYNTFHELMHARVPTVFLPQEKVADEQDARASVAARLGAGRLVPALDDALLSARVEAEVRELLEPTTHAAAQAAAAAMVPDGAAHRGALELLSLVLPAAELDVLAAIDAPHLLALTMFTGGGTSGHTDGGGPTFDQLADMAQAVAGRTLDRAALIDAPLADVLDALPKTAATTSAMGDSVQALVQLGRRLPGDDLPARLRTMRVLLALVARFDDWPGAALYLRTWNSPRGATLAIAAADLERRLVNLLENKRDLYHGLAELVGSSRADSEETL